MTLESYKNSEEWKNCLAALEKKTRLEQLIGRILLIVGVPLAVAEIVFSVIPEDWFEGHNLLMIVFSCLFLALGVAFVALSAWAQNGSNSGGAVNRNTFRMQSLMAEKIEAGKFYMGGTLNVRADFRFTDGKFKRRGADICGLNLVGLSGTETVELPFQGEALYPFLVGFLNVLAARFLVKLTEKGERVDVAVITMSVEGEPFTVGKDGNGWGAFYVKNGKLTLIGKSRLKRVKKLENEFGIGS